MKKQFLLIISILILSPIIAGCEILEEVDSQISANKEVVNCILDEGKEIEVGGLKLVLSKSVTENFASNGVQYDVEKFKTWAFSNNYELINDITAQLGVQISQYIFPETYTNDQLQQLKNNLTSNYADCNIGGVTGKCFFEYSLKPIFDNSISSLLLLRSDTRALDFYDDIRNGDIALPHLEFNMIWLKGNSLFKINRQHSILGSFDVDDFIQEDITIREIKENLPEAYEVFDFQEIQDQMVGFIEYINLCKDK